MQDVPITMAVATVLQRFLDQSDEQRYGYDLMRVTGFPSGKLYPILDRLERAGWLESEFEVIDQKVERRPPRRWYRLTGEAVQAARAELAFLHQQLAPAPRTGRRLHPHEGSA